MSTEHPCEVCGATTRNPKFCSDACAARQNNRSTSKRRPEGTCGECGAAILKRKRYCEACAAAVAERERKVKEGFVTIRTSAGAMEVKAPPVWVHKEVVFKAPAITTTPSHGFTCRGGSGSHAKFPQAGRRGAVTTL
ncbi:hypothetical protein OV079_49335 [Nannocystis pusilla]|uniref:Uncharacterized protein n=1 Tax=Nannocystis pusilla TaxID=889268 RepID=A0A9X3F2I2_9BACT|nr:hypothetical protein [Nannocystis pusilla]MCY1013404.1 hypothetical protein [Nannocystis pusilla]